ncbi:MAG: hypothetical protein IPO04_21780 [Cytophagaceae bacterium]|nr:hypothetical protein [Cytophagaceae bacterium]
MAALGVLRRVRLTWFLLCSDVLKMFSPEYHSKEWQDIPIPNDSYRAKDLMAVPEMYQKL